MATLAAIWLLAAAGALLLPLRLATADPLSEGKCREDPAATKSLWQAIDCRLTGWDDYVSCADSEAAPDRCDHDDRVSRDLRKTFGNPFFRTRAAGVVPIEGRRTQRVQHHRFGFAVFW